MSIQDNIPLNFAILKAPENWIILTLMVSIVLLGLALIFHERPSLPGQAS